MASKPTGKPNGRPRQFETVEEMEEMIEAYFAKCGSKQALIVNLILEAVRGLRKGASNG